MSDPTRRRPKFRTVHSSNPYVTTDDYPPNFIAPVPDGAQFDWAAVEEEPANKTASPASKQPPERDAAVINTPTVAPRSDGNEKSNDGGGGRSGAVMADPDGPNHMRNSQRGEGIIGNNSTQHANNIDAELSRRVSEVNRNQLSTSPVLKSSKSPEDNRYSPFQNSNSNRVKKWEKKKKAKKPSVSITCDICNLTVTSEGNYRDHLRGKVHTTNLRQKEIRDRNSSLKSTLNFSPVLPPVQSNPTQTRSESPNFRRQSPDPTADLSQLTLQPSNTGPSSILSTVQPASEHSANPAHTPSASHLPPSASQLPSSALTKSAVGRSDDHGSSTNTNSAPQKSSTTAGSVAAKSSQIIANESVDVVDRNRQSSTSVPPLPESIGTKGVSSSKAVSHSSPLLASPVLVDYRNSSSLKTTVSKDPMPEKDPALSSSKPQVLISPLTPFRDDETGPSGSSLLSMPVSDKNVSKGATVASVNTTDIDNINSSTGLDSARISPYSDLTHDSNAGKAETPITSNTVLEPLNRAAPSPPGRTDQTVTSFGKQPSTTTDDPKAAKETTILTSTEFRENASKTGPPLNRPKHTSHLGSSYNAEQSTKDFPITSSLPAPSSVPAEKSNTSKTFDGSSDYHKSHVKPPFSEKLSTSNSDIGKFRSPASTGLESDKNIVSPPIPGYNNSKSSIQSPPIVPGSAVGEKRKRSELISVDERDLIRRRRETSENADGRRNEGAAPISRQKSNDPKASPEASPLSKPDEGSTTIEANANETITLTEPQLLMLQPSEAATTEVAGQRSDQTKKSAASPLLNKNTVPVRVVDAANAHTADPASTGQSKSHGNGVPHTENPRESATAAVVAFPSVGDEQLFPGAQKVPREWLEEPMPKSEWLEMRNNILRPDSTSPDVDQLAFKIMQEILLSPIRGMKFHALAPFSRALLAAVPDHYAVPQEGFFARFSDVKKVMKGPNAKFRDGDTEWMEKQSDEALSVALFEENLEFTFKTYEDRDCVQQQSKDQFPSRGTFGPRRPPDRMFIGHEGERSGRYDDSVSNDPLFNRLFGYRAIQEDNVN